MNKLIFIIVFLILFGISIYPSFDRLPAERRSDIGCIGGCPMYSTKGFPLAYSKKAHRSGIMDGSIQVPARHTNYTNLAGNILIVIIATYLVGKLLIFLHRKIFAVQKV